jgi:hypothetical protein
VKASSYLTSPLLALVALALVPMIARAETSGEKVYNPALHTIESQGIEKPAHSAKPKTGKEDTAPATEPEGEPGSEAHHQSEATPPSAGGNHPHGGGGSGKGKPAKASPGPDRKPEESISPRQKVSTPTKATAHGGNDDGGSSPVLPILIAMAVLAAISIGIVLYRERGGHPFRSRAG